LLAALRRLLPACGRHTVADPVPPQFAADSAPSTPVPRCTSAAALLPCRQHLCSTV